MSTKMSKGENAIIRDTRTPRQYLEELFGGTILTIRGNEYYPADSAVQRVDIVVQKDKEKIVVYVDTELDVKNSRIEDYRIVGTSSSDLLFKAPYKPVFLTKSGRGAGSGGRRGSSLEDDCFSSCIGDDISRLADREYWALCFWTCVLLSEYQPEGQPGHTRPSGRKPA
jgi:hypothetical protein